MDEKTKTLLDNFGAFLGTHLKEKKELKHLTIDIGKWSLSGIKASYQIFINQELFTIDFDLREIKENEDHFLHLIDYTISQILEKASS